MKRGRRLRTLTCRCKKERKKKQGGRENEQCCREWHTLRQTVRQHELEPCVAQYPTRCCAAMNFVDTWAVAIGRPHVDGSLLGSLGGHAGLLGARKPCLSRARLRLPALQMHWPAFVRPGRGQRVRTEGWHECPSWGLRFRVWGFEVGIVMSSNCVAQFSAARIAPKACTLR